MAPVRCRLGPGAVRSSPRSGSQPFWDLVGLVEPTAARPLRRPRVRHRRADRRGRRAARHRRHGRHRHSPSDARRRAHHARPACASSSATSARGRRQRTAATHDLVLANASLHWVPDHAAVLARWAAALAPGGQLAVQVPANADHPSHLVAAEVAATEPFVSAMGGPPPPDPVAVNVLRPEQYATLLYDLGVTPTVVRLQVYGARADSTSATSSSGPGHVADPLLQASARPSCTSRSSTRTAGACSPASATRPVLLPVQADPDVGSA